MLFHLNPGNLQGQEQGRALREVKEKPALLEIDNSQFVETPINELHQAEKDQILNEEGFGG
jgi:hypothetical protein